MEEERGIDSSIDRSANLDGVLEADRLGEVLALLLRHVDRKVGALLRGDRLALCLGNLKISGQPKQIFSRNTETEIKLSEKTEFWPKPNILPK